MTQPLPHSAVDDTSRNDDALPGGILPDDGVISFGGAVKALGDGVVGGHLILWGSPTERDLHREYFDAARTNLMMDDYPVKGERVLYHHGKDARMSVSPLSKFTDAGIDEVGLWVKTQLDLANPYQQAIYRLVEAGKLGWSSGALPASVKTAPDGAIEQWAIIEGSLTPTPADYRNRAVVLPVKAYLEWVQDHDLPVLEGLDQPTGLDTSIEAPVDGVSPTPTLSPAIDVRPTTKDGDLTMDAAQMQRLAKTAIAAVAAAHNLKMSDADVDALAAKAMADCPPEEDETMTPAKYVTNAAFTARITELLRAQQKLEEDAVTAATKTNLAAQRQPASAVTPVTTPRSPQISVSTKYASLSANDMAFMLQVRRQGASKRYGTTYTPDEKFVRELADKAAKSFEKGEYAYLPDDSEGGSKAWNAVNAIKSGEFDYSTSTGYGDEWVADLWSSELWRLARIESRVLSLLQTVDMPSNPYELPLESTDPTVYRVPEIDDQSDAVLSATTTFTTSKMATGKTTLTAYKLGLQSLISTELEEDSIIPFVPQIRTNALISMNNALEMVVLNADSSTGTSNINKQGYNVQSTDLDKWLLGFTGIVYLPLVTAPSTLSDGTGGTPTLSMLRTIRRKLPARYINRMSDLVYITDPTTATRLIDIDEVLTMDKIGAQATVLNGQLGMIDGIPIVQSEWLSLAQSTGYVSQTAASNTLGRILLVHRPSWKVGYRRRVNMSVDFLSYRDMYVLTSTARAALAKQDSQCATLAYNVTV